jgi:hypothetical protein
MMVKKLDGTDLNPDTDGDGVVDGVEVTDSTGTLGTAVMLLKKRSSVLNHQAFIGRSDGDGILNG